MLLVANCVGQLGFVIHGWFFRRLRRLPVVTAHSRRLLCSLAADFGALPVDSTVHRGCLFCVDYAVHLGCLLCTVTQNPNVNIKGFKLPCAGFETCFAPGTDGADSYTHLESSLSKALTYIYLLGLPRE